MDMASVLDGLRVVDLSSGIAGPIVGMLLSDHGAQVTKVERPGGDPYRSMPGSQVWLRGRRSVELDLTDEADLEVARRLIDAADVVIDSTDIDTARQRGLDPESTRARNPRLVHCRITAYGDRSAWRDRPAIEALVMARTGLQWVNRGNYKGAGRAGGGEDFLPDFPIPEGMEPGSPREGPIFNYSPWLCLEAAMLASAGINAALLARETTGRGQSVETSLLQAAMACTTAKWLRVQEPDTPLFQSWIYDRRAPKGFFLCSDGRWVQQWVPNPNFVLSSADGDELAMRRGDVKMKDDPDRISPDPENLVVLAHYHPLMAEAVAKFPSTDWTRVAAEAGVPLQPVRTPEEALADEALISEGAIVTLPHPEHGELRQAGILYGLDRTPGRIQGPVPRVGEHNDEVRREAASAVPVAAESKGETLSHGPLSGVVVLDLGFAVAGPYGTQLLADLGATVIKVNATRDPWWHAMHIAFGANRGKRSVCIDLKTERGREVLHELVRKADVVHSNMRRPALAKLGVDEASLRKVNPDIVYCHTRGFDRGPRSECPGNDQTGASLAGVTWEDGAGADGGKPFWSMTSLGDIGNGMLSAIGVIQALYHRKRTGEGQSVDTSILNACMLTASTASVFEDGSAFPRPHLDRMQLGMGPQYRLYETSDGWLCVAALTDDHWRSLLGAFGRYDLLPKQEKEITEELEAEFQKRTAADAFATLDGVGVPCEISDQHFGEQVFDNPEMISRGLVVTQQHPQLGKYETVGTMIDFSETPGTIWGPPPLVGQHSREILREFGFEDAQIDDLIADKAVFETILAAR